MRVPKSLFVPLAIAVAATWAPASAAGAVWAGAVDDPPDRRGEADVSAASLRYDDAGALLLAIRFHEPVAADDPVAIDWVVTGEADATGCGDTRRGVAGLLEPRDGDTTLTYTEVPAEEIPVTVEVPARQNLSADRRELTVHAESASLAKRSLACSQIALSNGDDVARILLRQVAAGRPGTGPPEVKIEGGGEPTERRVGGLRVSRVRLAYERRGRRVVGSLRALVCAPPGLRIVAEIGERRQRVGTRRSGPQRRYTFTRRQRVRCHFHRWSWRFRADPRARYRVLVDLRLRALEARAVGR